MKRCLTALMAVLLIVGTAVIAYAEPTGLALQPDETTHDTTISLENETISFADEYEFPIVADMTGGGVAALTPANIGDYKLTATITAGSGAISSAKIDENDAGQYILRLTTKNSYTTKVTSCTVSVKLLTKTTSKTAATAVASFKVGWKTATDIPTESGEYISVDPEYPVFTKSQLSKIAKLNNYKNVTFASDEWEFTTNITDVDSLNMTYNKSTIKEIVTRLQDQEFQFLNFPAATQFDVSGKMKIFVSDYYDDFNGNFYVYRYINGKLARINALYDPDDESLNFSTNTLGRFVITDTVVTNTNILTILPEGERGTNPDTGASDMVNVAATLAVLSLVTAGAVLFRKKTR